MDFEQGQIEAKQKGSVLGSILDMAGGAYQGYQDGGGWGGALSGAMSGASEGFDWSSLGKTGKSLPATTTPQNGRNLYDRLGGTSQYVNKWRNQTNNW